MFNIRYASNELFCSGVELNQIKNVPITTLDFSVFYLIFVLVGFKQKSYCPI